MFGFSITKLLLLLAVVVAIWQGVKLFRRFQLMKQALDQAEAKTAVDDLTACAVCGSYVTADRRGSCGRADCPARA